MKWAPKQQMTWHHINPTNLKRKSQCTQMCCKHILLVGTGSARERSWLELETLANIFILKQEKEPPPFICVF